MNRVMSEVLPTLCSPRKTSLNLIGGGSDVSCLQVGRSPAQGLAS